MVDTSNPVGCLGRTLIIFGVLWIGLAVLGGAGILSQLGFGPAAVAWVGGSIIPGLVLIGVGRAITRRSATLAGRPEPPVEISLPTPVPPPPPPSGATGPGPIRERRPPEQMPEAEPDRDQGEGKTPLGEPAPPRLMSSQERVEEARRRWGAKGPGERPGA